MEVIYNVLAKGESLVVMGDLNRHIGSDHLGVNGNHDKISFGGSLVRDLIDTGDVILVNNWSERSACAALRRCCGTKYPLFLGLFVLISFSATYFSPRRGCPRVMKFCTEF